MAEGLSNDIMFAFLDEVRKKFNSSYSYESVSKKPTFALSEFNLVLKDLMVRY
jgi:hypothetical protein